MFEKFSLQSCEIALRIQRAAAKMASKRGRSFEADREAKYVKLATSRSAWRPVRIKLSDMPAIISAAEVTDAQAIHPGYGFFVRKTPTLPSASSNRASSLSDRARIRFA